MEGKFEATIPGKILPGRNYVIPIHYYGDGEYNYCETFCPKEFFERIINDIGYELNGISGFHDVIRDLVNNANEGIQYLTDDKNCKSLFSLLITAAEEELKKSKIKVSLKIYN